MKLVALALAALPLAVLAAPTYDHEWKDDKVDKHYEDDHKWDDKHADKWEDKHHDDKHDGEEKWYKDSFPFHFTSTIVGYASPDTIVNNSQVAVPGLEDGWGKFAFGLNSEENVICYNISVWLKGNYSSPAVTATHIHQAVAGRAGPPRIAFPNPRVLNGESIDEFSWRRSVGCVWGPFTTGVVVNGTDTGAGFTVADLEADPTGFFADTHTVQFPAGAIRGQLEWK
ncbi:hypothetical protein CI109_104466 [Kwoniella shandongensis]|uniref:Uncharacterized protein n=1 Tax=Kwoniella shandongensis TaxID=1734106 RepID=A0A5M6BND3_9TREE|nr:uncharacterized protein CI109_007316 [Kwoniella shandongensis]KAA5524368.1 hypothetical protein CI109_007316 [Kwoniella shandongensis]